MVLTRLHTSYLSLVLHHSEARYTLQSYKRSSVHQLRGWHWWQIWAVPQLCCYSVLFCSVNQCSRGMALARGMVLTCAMVPRLLVIIMIIIVIGWIFTSEHYTHRWLRWQRSYDQSINNTRTMMTKTLNYRFARKNIAITVIVIATTIIVTIIISMKRTWPCGSIISGHLLALVTITWEDDDPDQLWLWWCWCYDGVTMMLLCMMMLSVTNGETNYD